MRQFIGRGVRALARDNKGTVAMLFGLAVIPILLGVGVAVDYGRGLIVRDRMAAAADSAALAAASWPGLSEAELKTKVQEYFDANFPPTALGAVGTLNVSLVGDDIVVQVSATVPTTIMQIANIDKLDVGVTNRITKKERAIELALVLDTTGSMDSGGKMSAMQNAANKMLDTLFEGKSVSDSLKVAVVPFSAAVNIGVDKLNSGWLDKTAGSIMSYEDFNSSVKVLDLYAGLNNRSWGGCVRERDEPYVLTDDAPTSANTRWAPYFAPDEPGPGDGSSTNNARYCNDYVSDGSYSSATCYDKGTSDNHRRQCYPGKYAGKNADNRNCGFNNPVGPNMNCPPNAVTALTNTKSTVVDAVNALAPRGSTVIPAGLLWGWRVISPTEPFTEGKPYDDEKWVKAIVVLTDGQNDVGGGLSGFNKSYYNAFGFAKSGHLGSTSGSDAESTLNAKTLTVCNAIKAKGVRVYTIGFQITDATTKNLLRDCATEPEMSYNSPSNAELAGIFQDIAQGLSELRIAQ